MAGTWPIHKDGSGSPPHNKVVLVDVVSVVTVVAVRVVAVGVNAVVEVVSHFDGRAPLSELFSTYAGPSSQ